MVNATEQSLNVHNFISSIKKMSARERSHVGAACLIELIIQLPDEDLDLKNTVNELVRNFRETQTTTIENQREIAMLKADNLTLRKLNADNTVDIRKMSQDLHNQKAEMNDIQRYLRVNNVEIAGLPDPSLNDEGDEIESTEEIVLDCLNSLQPEKRLSSDDIDICHPIPSKNGGKTHVVRFISRKSKINIITAKKKQENRNFKYKDKDVFINDHLTPINKDLFNQSKRKKGTGEFKYVWTKDGKVFVRETDRSPVIHITDLHQLTPIRPPLPLPPIT